MRTFVFGDIHGCYKTLVALMKRLHPDSRCDRIIFLGDYTDRGPDSFKVFEYLRNLKKKYGERLMLVYGNHEDMLIDFFEKGDDLWDYNGSSDTKMSFCENLKNGPRRDVYYKFRFENYMRFIKNNTSLFYETDEFYAAHAGLLNCPPETVMDKYDFIWDRVMFKSSSYRGKLCFIGHTPVKSPCLSYIDSGDGYEMKKEMIPYEYEKEYLLPSKGLLNIDTGCVFGYKLTAAVVSDGKMIFYCMDKLD